MDISRSGRIRKKSSKLADFESSADLDLYPIESKPSSSTKKKPAATHSVMTSSQNLKNPASFVDALPPDQLLADDDFIQNDEDFDVDVDIKEEDFDDIPFVADDDDDFNDTGNAEAEDSDDSEDGNLMIDDSRGKSSKSRPVSTSIYLSEKARKASMAAAAGRGKLHRRDKGVRRITAFMLWAKHVRPEIAEANPRLDFSSMSKRLGEIWSTVSASEKDLWKRRAKRFAAKEKSHSAVAKVVATPTLARQSLGSPQRRQVQTGLNSPTYGRASAVDHVTSYGNFKTSGTQPIDCAAHLKLLGESLSVIGERLTEHEGQIAVSGSLSVLLDSLLCALGPIMCLTQQVPELNVVPQETLSRTLDNIAFIMPGL